MALYYIVSYLIRCKWYTEHWQNLLFENNTWQCMITNNLWQYDRFVLFDLTLHMTRIGWYPNRWHGNFCTIYTIAHYTYILLLLCNLCTPVLRILIVSKWLVFQACKKPQNCQINLRWIVANRCISFCRLPWRRLENRIVKHGAGEVSGVARLTWVKHQGYVWT